MRSFVASTSSSCPDRKHPALYSFADECCGVLARLVAYVGALALLAILGVHLWDRLPEFAHVEAVLEKGWSEASLSKPAFAVSNPDSIDKTVTYEIFRHSEGGRKDILRWGTPGERPVAELEIYRPGNEPSQAGSATAEIAERMSFGGRTEPEAAGVVDSKFGMVALLRLAGSNDSGRGCLGFVKRLDEPDLRIAGWTCQGENLTARRAAISCVLGRLTLLAAGNDPRLAELFARAELRRGSCAAAPSTDWVTAPQDPGLRGTL
jgi:hypothetical protein